MDRHGDNGGDNRDRHAIAKTEGEAAGFLQAGLWGGLRLAALFLGLYFALSIALRLALPDSLTLDEAEQALFSQYWRLGYGPQPPFYNWMQNAVVAAIGLSPFSLALPKFALLLLAYVFYGLAAKEIDSRPGFAATAMLSLVTLPQVSYMPQQDLTHTTAVLMASALFLLGLVRVLNRGDGQGYAIAGIAIGIGMISKYNFALLPAAAAMAIFCDRPWRARLFNRRVLVTAVIALAIFLPHGIWLAGNLGEATSGTLGKMTQADAPEGLTRILIALGSLALACLAFGALTFAIFAIAFRDHIGAALQAGNRWTRLIGLTMLLSLAGVVGVILLTGTTRIVERWLDPYLLTLPLYLLLKLELAGARPATHLRRLMPVLAAILTVSLLAPAAITLCAGWTGRPTRLNYPFSAIAERLAAEGRPALILADGMHLAGNMRLQFPDVPVIDSRKPPDDTPPASIRNGPVLVVWPEDGSGKPPVSMDVSPYLAMGYAASAPGAISRAYHYMDGMAQPPIGYLWLRPGASAIP